MRQQTDSRSDSRQDGQPGDPMQQPPSFGWVARIAFPVCGDLPPIELNTGCFTVFVNEVREWPDDNPEEWSVVDVVPD